MTGFPSPVYPTSENENEPDPERNSPLVSTVAPVTDVGQRAAIQADRVRVDLLPTEQVVDASSVSGRNLVTSRRDHQIDLTGPTHAERDWQAKAGDGFDLAHFSVDWDAVVTCPQGGRRLRSYQTQTAPRPHHNTPSLREDCRPCPVRSQCTRATLRRRSLPLPPQAEHEAMQGARQRDATVELTEQYARRAGIAGTISQGVRAFGLRQARYRGLAKTHLEHVATATASTIRRLADWLNAVLHVQTRCSPFGALAPVV